MTPEGDTTSPAYEKRTKELLSPAFTLIDTFPEGTEKIRISWKNWDQNASYFLKQFDPKKSTFTANFRLNLGNIAAWENEYLIRFYLPDGQVKEGQFSLPCYFSEIKLWPDTLYLNDNRANLTYHTIINAYGAIDKKKSDLILIQHNGTYYTEDTPFLVDMKNGILYQITNATQIEDHLYGDVQKYKEGILAKHIRMFYPTMYDNTRIDYNQQLQEIQITNTQGDSCQGSEEYGVYDTANQKYTKDIYQYNADCDNFEITIQNLLLWQELKVFTTIVLDGHNNDDWKDDTVTDDGVKYQYAILSNGKYIKQKEGHLVEYHTVVPYYDTQTEDIYPGVEARSSVNYDTMILTVTIDNKKFQRNLNDLSTFTEF